MADKEYDKILVECCACCLSLDKPRRMKIAGKYVSVCRHCGHTEVSHMTIEKWEEKFVRKYNIGRYLDLPKGMTWEEIMHHENKETAEEENIRRMIRNRNIDTNIFDK